MDKLYITTPIYYVNDVPHIGHAYTTIAADILARYFRLNGRRVFFLTGTDEHGQKVEKASAKKGLTPKEHADLMVEHFKNLWAKLEVSNDAFIRTTDPEHIKTVQSIIQMLRDRGKIAKRKYSGWYCTPDERFWTEKEIIDGNCPDCGRSVEKIQEENYFFLMSQYQERLIRHIEDNPEYVLPETRRNEVLGFLKNNTLEDLCISRPKSRLSWGIPFPFDEGFVTYVWFDALLNYFSATRYLVPDAGKAKPGEFWWPAQYHIIGKDILTTHAVYWSTMLMALNFPLPGHIFAHGWWTVGGKKMSKSLDNVVDPRAVVTKYGIDAFRYFLFREVPFGLDGDFSEEAMINRINTDLANDLGNLLSRFLAMAEKYLEGIIELPSSGTSPSNKFAGECVNAVSGATNAQNWVLLRFHVIIDHIWNIVRATNNFIATEEPWKLAKNNSSALKKALFSVWKALRLIALLINPFMPGTSERIWKQLGLQSLPGKTDSFPEMLEWDWSPDYRLKVSREEPLFPRIEKTNKTKETSVVKKISRKGQ